MPGTQLSRRHFSIRARENQRKLKHGSKRMATSCCKDLVNPELAPIKIIFFFIMGATQCVAPYSTLFMKALGLTVEETAFIFTIAPLIPIAAPLLAGILTDKIGNFKRFLVVSVVLSGIFSLVHVLIPPARTKHLSPEGSIKFGLTCEDEMFKISYIEPAKCTLPVKLVTLDSISVKRCGYLCSPPAVQMDKNFRKIAKKIKVPNFLNDSYVYICEISLSDKQKCFEKNLNLSDSINEFSLRDVILDFEKAERIGKMVLITPDDFATAKSDSKANDCKADISIRKLLITTSSWDESDLGFVQCKSHCEGTFKKNSICNDTSETVIHNVSLSFWLFVVANMVGTFMIGLTYTMFEAGVMAILKEHNYDYGIQRIYGSFGGMVFAPLTGYLIDYFGNGEQYSDYYIGYYLYCTLNILCAFILTRLDLRFRKPSRNICGNITEIFTSIESLLLILIVFVSGMCYGFIEHFLPWHIRDLGAENWMIGLMTTVASIAAMPVLAMSDFLCKKFGHVQCISFGLICYAIRCFGYSMLKNPFWCFPFEVLEGVTTGLLVAAAIIYGAKLSHQSNLGTLQGMLATSHYGFGKSVGSLLGGFIMSRLGARVAFRIFSGGAFVVAFVYYLIFKLLIHPKEEQLEKLRREVSAMTYEVIPKRDMGEGLGKVDRDDVNSEEIFPVTSTPKKNFVYPTQYV